MHCTPRILKASRASVEYAAGIVKAGGIVVYPTDTVYGVGGNPLWEYSVWRVFRAKRRPFNRPVPVLVAGVEYVDMVAYVTPKARRLMEAFWPGPLTIVLKAKPSLPPIVTGYTGRVGVRMPRHGVALELIELAGGLLVGTSANLHNYPPPRTVVEAVRQLECNVDAYIDAGPAPGGRPSTVVDLSGGKPRIIREGPIGLDEITSVLR